MATTVAEERALAAEVAAHRLAQERAGAVAHDIGRQSPGFIHATHPEHGEAVVFVPGELLPGWVVEALDGGRGRYDAATGVFVLDDPAPPKKGRRT
jgi:hypothetical protein